LVPNDSFLFSDMVIIDLHRSWYGKFSNGDTYQLD
jgi:hypothetical protein